MEIVAFILSYDEPRAAKSVPPGLLAIYPKTKEAVACSISPLSSLLTRAFRSGVKFSSTDALHNVVVLKADKNDFDRFFETAGKYFGRAGMRLRRLELTSPLPDILCLDGNYNVCSSGKPAFTLRLKGVSRE